MAQRHPVFQWFSDPDQYQVQISAENMAPRTLIVTKMVFGGHPLALKSTDIRRFHGAEIDVKCTPDFEMRVHAQGEVDPVYFFMLPSKEIATSLKDFAQGHGILKNPSNHILYKLCSYPVNMSSQNMDDHIPYKQIQSILDDLNNKPDENVQKRDLLLLWNHQDGNINHIDTKFNNEIGSLKHRMDFDQHLLHTCNIQRQCVENNMVKLEEATKKQIESLQQSFENEKEQTKMRETNLKEFVKDEIEKAKKEVYENVVHMKAWNTDQALKLKTVCVTDTEHDYHLKFDL